jgi:hypothetical protein
MICFPGKFCIPPGGCASHSNVLLETNECSSMMMKHKKRNKQCFFFLLILNDRVFPDAVHDLRESFFGRSLAKQFVGWRVSTQIHIATGISLLIP